MHIIVRSSLGSAPLRCFSTAAFRISTTCCALLKCVERNKFHSSLQCKAAARPLVACYRRDARKPSAATKASMASSVKCCITTT